MSFSKMKEKLAGYLFCCILITLASSSCSKAEKKDHEFSEDEIQSLSETMGYLLFENLKTQHLKLDIDSMIKGIKNARDGGKPPLTKEEYYQMLSSYKNHLIKMQAAENKKIAEDFLAEMGSKAGVVSLDNGKVQYTILQEGQGRIVKETDIPLVNYVGMLIDGTVFDNTKAKGNPVLLPLQSTIAGFQLAVVGMKEGELRRIYIHPDLGFGTYESLPPGSLLIFDLEVVTSEGNAGMGSLQLSRDHSNEVKNETSTGSIDTETSLRWLNKIREAIF